VAVKANDNFTYTVTSKKDAVKALRMMQERQEEIARIERENGIPELRQEATELKKAATMFCVARKISQLDMGDSYAQLREDGYDRRWIATRHDLEDVDAPGAVPLRTILQRALGGKSEEFKAAWNRITKRVIDADALQEIVDEGIVDEDEIAPAFVEKKRAPYLRIYSKGE
jgi:hypothetical protein